jgi:hypothetical protein
VSASLRTARTRTRPRRKDLAGSRRQGLFRAGWSRPLRPSPGPARTRVVGRRSKTMGAERPPCVMAPRQGVSGARAEVAAGPGARAEAAAGPGARAEAGAGPGARAEVGAGMAPAAEAVEAAWAPAASAAAAARPAAGGPASGWAAILTAGRPPAAEVATAAAAAGSRVAPAAAAPLGPAEASERPLGGEEWEAPCDVATEAVPRRRFGRAGEARASPRGAQPRAARRVWMSGRYLLPSLPVCIGGSRGVP